MRFTRTSIALVAFLAAFAVTAVAQSVVQPTLSGNETWNVGQGPGGPGGFITSNLVRNSTAMATKSGSGSATSTAAGGTLCWVSTAPTTWTVTLPANPGNGTVVRLCTDTTLTSMVTVAAGTGDTLTTTFNSQTLTANASFPAWQYYRTTKVWYRVQ